MKALFLSTVGLILTSPLFAAASERTDNSMFLVYLFLGVCGMIIFLQMIPIFALLIGIVRAFFVRKNEAL